MGASRVRDSIFRLTSAAYLAAAPALALEEPFCTEPAKCVEDVLSLRFPLNGTSEINDVRPGDEFDLQVSIDVKSAHVQGFSYGVKHDPAVLEILRATHRGSGVDPVIRDYPFITTVIGQDKSGFIQATVLVDDAEDSFELPLMDGLKLAGARYRMAKDAALGTRIEFSNDINPPKSPKTATNLTIAGRSKQPAKVNNAVVNRAGDGCALLAGRFGLYFGPAARREDFEIAGATEVPVALRNVEPLVAFVLGIRKTGGSLTFDSPLGAPPIELALVRADGSRVGGAALERNAARGAPAAPIIEVRKGAALAGITGDFFASRLVPAAEGGPGVNVAYVVDLEGSLRVIPPVTDTAADCGAHEILLLSFGHIDAFSRGDANGDGRITVTDGILVAHHIFTGKVAAFDCRDMVDVNDDGRLNTADPVFLLTHVFLKGPAPAAPFRSCGSDPTADDLRCGQGNCR